MKPLTLPEYFGQRFNSNKVRFISAITLIFGIGVYLIAVSQGLALVVSNVTGLSYSISLLMIMLGYLIFTVYSGSEGVIITDTIMFLIFTTAAILIAPLVINAAGGWPEVIYQLSDYSARSGILSWHGVLTGESAVYSSRWGSLAYAITFGFVWMIVVAVSPWQASRYIMAKDEQTILRSGTVVMAIVAIIYPILHLTVANITLINPNITPVETVLVWTAQNVLPTWLGIILVAGIVAAGLSTSSTFLSLIGFSVIHDIQGISNMNFSIQYDNIDSQLFLSRFSMAIVGIIVFVIAYYQPPAVLWLGWFAASIFAASWGPIAFASVHWKQVSKTGALWGIILGFVAVITFKILVRIGVLSLPVYFPAELLGFLGGLAGVVIGSYRNGPNPTEQERRQEMINGVGTTTSEKIQRTLTYTRIVILVGFFLSIGLFIYYYIPYTGTV